MGFGGINIWSLVIILAIIILLFGTKKLKTLGSDLGSAIKGFKSSVSDDEKSNEAITNNAKANTENDAEFANDVKKETTKE